MVEKQVTIKVDTKYGQTGSPSTMTQGLDQTMKKMSASAGTLQKYANLSGLTMGQVQEGFSDIMQDPTLMFDSASQQLFQFSEDAMSDTQEARDKIWSDALKSPEAMAGTVDFKDLKRITDTGTAGKIKTSMIGAGKAVGGFKFEYLSLMFAGMAVSKMFMGQIQATMKLLGIYDMLNIMFTVALLPVMKLILPLFIRFFKIFMEQPKWVKFAIGVLIILITVIGIVAMVVGQAGLAIQGLAIMFGTKATATAVYGAAVSGLTLKITALNASIAKTVMLSAPILVPFAKLLVIIISIYTLIKLIPDLLWEIATLVVMMKDPANWETLKGMVNNNIRGLGGALPNPALGIAEGPLRSVRGDGFGGSTNSNVINNISIDATVANETDAEMLARRVEATLNESNNVIFKR